jgi:succinate dehydrogenase / fumarate reductase cytochrome b subunit
MIDRRAPQDDHDAGGLRSVLSSSVGTKLLIGLTGLLLFLFLILHLAGNLFIFAGQDTFNRYSHTLVSNPLTIPVEIALLLVFLVHLYKTIRNWIRNRSMRPVHYQQKRWAGYTSRKSISSMTMMWTGLVILFFVVIHLRQFKFGAWYEIGNPPIRDLYRTEVAVFGSAAWVTFYVIAVVLVGFHLRHGISSAFQSLGVNHPVYTKRLVVIGTVLAVIIGGGFAIIPIWVYLTR